MLTADDRKHILEQTGVAIGEIAKFDDGKELFISLLNLKTVF